jgi:hypothetical protein
MKAVTVCVDFGDILAKTLRYNRDNFDEVLIITSHNDILTHEVAWNNDVNLYRTDSFWANGAVFNKWVALEEGLDWMGREGWICLLDADIVWPKHAYDSLLRYLRPGFLYCPRRRMCLDIPDRIPDESTWNTYPLHPQDRELAGYSQIFHASDPALGKPPWHQTDWKHAGGADSFLQAKWRNECKVRTPFEVLHIGPSGENWCGRASRLSDGTMPKDHAKKTAMVHSFLAGRRGKVGDERFRHERISQNTDSVSQDYAGRAIPPQVDPPTV